MTSNCEPQCKIFFVGDIFVSRIHCTKIVLIFITTLLFDIIAILCITLLWCVHPVFVPKIGIRQYHRTILWFRQNLTRDCCCTNIFTWRLFPGTLQNHRVFLWRLTKNCDVIYDIDDGLSLRLQKCKISLLL